MACTFWINKGYKATGTYNVSLTADGEGLTDVSIDITYTVTVTGVDNPPAKVLKAWVQNGTLHVSGLTVGEPWATYHIN